MYVSTREYIETDLGYLLGDQYNRLITALDFYHETRKHIAYNYFQEQYKNRGMRLLTGGDVGKHEQQELDTQNSRMRDFQPTRDDRTMVWSLLGKKKELMGSESKSADWGRLELEEGEILSSDGQRIDSVWFFWISLSGGHMLNFLWKVGGLSCCDASRITPTRSWYSKQSALTTITAMYT